MSDKKEQHKPNLVRELTEKLVSGAIAGIIGSSATFPLDVVKTRLQNQKIGPNGEREYKGMIDCFQKSMKVDGLRGMYRALPAVIVGITPEKAIKLGVNDFVCDIFKRQQKVEKLSIPYLVAAGGIAGSCQVVATNPMEIVKIRMQLQGTTPGAEKQSMGQVARELGITGLYTGIRATLLRDVPFSMIYFSIYGYLRQKATDKDGNIGLFKAFLCGAAAGTVASSSSTPADVIKTRLQVKGSPYTGIIDCATKTIKHEGAGALLKGLGPRIIVISPLFGIALAVFEVQKFLLKKYGI